MDYNVPNGDGCNVANMANNVAQYGNHPFLGNVNHDVRVIRNTMPGQCTHCPYRQNDVAQYCNTPVKLIQIASNYFAIEPNCCKIQGGVKKTSLSLKKIVYW